MELNQNELRLVAQWASLVNNLRVMSDEEHNLFANLLKSLEVVQEPINDE